ncbi:hypothetical protein D3C87_1306110 [compost metagenome]
MHRQRGPAPIQHMVPHGFGTVFRDRERDAAKGALGNGAGAAVDQFGAGGVFQRVVIHPLRRGGGATGLVHIDAIGVRETLEHFLGAIAEFAGVLRKVFRGDAEQRFVCGKRVGTLAALFERRIDLGVTTVPRRNGAVGIAGTLGAKRRQVFRQLGRVFRRRSARHLAANGQATQQCKAKGFELEGSGFLVMGHAQVLLKRGLDGERQVIPVFQRLLVIELAGRVEVGVLGAVVMRVGQAGGDAIQVGGGDADVHVAAVVRTERADHRRFAQREITEADRNADIDAGEELAVGRGVDHLETEAVIGGIGVKGGAVFGDIQQAVPGDLTDQS